MDSKSATQVEERQQETQPETPVSNPDAQRGNDKPASYSMMEPKMRRIYGEFYREIYFSEAKHIDTKTQELISIAASLVAKCQGCIEGHIKKAVQAGATPEEISETISIAAAINAAAIIDLTDIAAANLDINNFPSQGSRFGGNKQ
ncbi:MAG: carboxymuconolactone decarboxylase family protein [Blastocatellia bacterium]|nr:carboxymuconolactone decarboxylase family protein [Blastocatellia bacterium]